MQLIQKLRDDKKCMKKVEPLRQWPQKTSSTLEASWKLLYVMGIREAEIFSERQKRELHALKAANVHAILETEHLVDEVLQGLKPANICTEAMDEWLALFNVKHRHMREDIEVVCLKCDLLPDDWIVDSGCTKHMTENRRLLTSYKVYDGGNVVFRSNLKCKVVDGGNITYDSITITNVEHVSGLAFNLISVAKGHGRNGLYTCKLGDNSKQQNCLASVVDNSTLWHRRLGHANMCLGVKGPFISQSSEIVERTHRKLRKMSRAMLDEQSVPQNFWCHAIDTATYIFNRVHLTKFDPKSYECVFLGYSQTSKAYTVLNKETMRIKESLNVSFDESLPEPKSSHSIQDDRIIEPIVQNPIRSPSLEANASESGYPKSLKEAKGYPIKQVTGELNERTLRSKTKQAYDFRMTFSKVQIARVMAAPIISISSNSSEESLGSHAPRVILFGAFCYFPLDYSSSSDSNPSEDSLPPAPDLPLVSPFLCFDDSEADATLIRPGEAIPFGRPYQTYLNGPRKMLSARKRVRPIPARRLAWRRVSLAFIGLSRRSEAFRRWRSAPLSTPYPPTTSDSSLGSSSKRSLDSSSLSSRPSHKRCRSPTASVPSPTRVSRSIAPTPADLLPHRKSFRDSYSPEDSGEEHMEVDTTDAEAVVDVGISKGVVAYLEDGVGMGFEITASYVREDDEEFEAEASAADTREIVVDPLAIGDSFEFSRGGIPDLKDTIYDIVHYMSEVRLDRTTEIDTTQRQLEASYIERDRIDSLRWHMALSQEEFRQVRRDRDDTRRRLRRLESYVERHLGFRP
ncbi:putative reverse transcriptase domain-containing protein [Tanacetum coccineum]